MPHLKERRRRSIVIREQHFGCGTVVQSLPVDLLVHVYLAYLGVWHSTKCELARVWLRLAPANPRCDVVEQQQTACTYLMYLVTILVTILDYPRVSRVQELCLDRGLGFDVKCPLA